MFGQVFGYYPFPHNSLGSIDFDTVNTNRPVLQAVGIYFLIYDEKMAVHYLESACIEFPSALEISLGLCPQQIFQL